MGEFHRGERVRLQRHRSLLILHALREYSFVQLNILGQISVTLMLSMYFLSASRSLEVTGKVTSWIQEGRIDQVIVSCDHDICLRSQLVVRLARSDVDLLFHLGLGVSSGGNCCHWSKSTSDPHARC